MYTFIQPSEKQLTELVQNAREIQYSYSAVGCTQHDVPPTGFRRDQATILLGRGQAVFQTACEVARQGDFFPSPMIRLFTLACPISSGQIVVAVYQFPCGGGWFSMPARVTAVFDDVATTAAGEIHRGGFTYGTLHGHLEAGEEQFLVQHHTVSDEVSFTITAISRPLWWPVWLAWPLARWEQARFRRLALARMRREIQNRIICASS